MADINKRLLTASDGIPAPQHKVKGESDFEFTEGSGGAQHTKIVDSSGQPISIDEELKSIKRTQAEILDRLDNGIDTRVTGSIVEVENIIIKTKGTYNLYIGDRVHSGPSIHGIDVSDFSEVSFYIENLTDSDILLQDIRVGPKRTGEEYVNLVNPRVSIPSQSSIFVSKLNDNTAGNNHILNIKTTHFFIRLQSGGDGPMENDQDIHFIFYGIKR